MFPLLPFPFPLLPPFPLAFEVAFAELVCTGLASKQLACIGVVIGSALLVDTTTGLLSESASWFTETVTVTLGGIGVLLPLLLLALTLLECLLVTLSSLVPMGLL